MLNMLLLCAACLFSPAVMAQEFISPLPDASKAKLKEAPSVIEIEEARKNADRTRHSALIGAHDFDALEKEIDQLERDYRDKKITPNELVEAILNFSTGVKSVVPDYEAWVKQRPNSYYARLILGIQQFDVAFAERGSAYARNTDPEQFASFERWMQASHDTLLRSLSLSRKPFISEYMLARIWGVRGMPGASSRLADTSSCARILKSSPDAEAAPLPLYYYTCLALKHEPEASRVLRAVIQLDSPRWGGDLARSSALLDHMERDHSMSRAALNYARQMWYAQAADDVVALGNDKRRAADFYLKAFQADPKPDRALYLWKAAQNYRKANALDDEIKVDEIAVRDPSVANLFNFDRAVVYDLKGDMRSFMKYMVMTAMNGNDAAQNNVGYFYMVGQRGLPKNLYAARAWLTLAANQGFQHAKDKLPVVERMIRDAERSKTAGRQ